MQAKPIVSFRHAAFLILALVVSPISSVQAQETLGTTAAKPPPAIPVVLYADPPTESDNIPQPILSARDALRSDRRLEVLSFNQESPTFVLAARHAELSLSPDDVASVDQRRAMSQAVGGSFFAVLSRHGKRSKTIDASLYEIAPVSQSWSYVDRDPNVLSQEMATQIVAANSQPTAPSQSPPAPATVPIASVTPPSAPAEVPETKRAVPPLAAPPVIAPSPSVTPSTPSTQTVPPVLTPVPSAPSVPSVQVAPVTNSTAPPPAPTAVPVTVPAAPVVKSAQIAAPQTPPVLAQAAAPQVAPTIAVTPLPVPRVLQAPAATPTPRTIPTALPSVVPAVPPAVAVQPSVVTPVVPPAPVVSEPVPVVATPSPEINLPATPLPGSVIGDDARRLMTTGDQQQRSSDYNGAIDTYRQAINLAPRAAEPRLKLAQAFLQAGMRDQAIKEARRALALDPSSRDARDFLTTLGASDSDETQIPTNQANVTANPKDQTAWIALGDSCWNANKLSEALAAYKSAVDLNPSAVGPQARLARFYAAQCDYDQSLTALDKAGSDGYPYALEIIASETENLFGEIDASEELFERGENTREQCYKRLKAADKAAQGLADFVAKVKPPDTYKLSHLHRQLSTRLLAQDTAGWLSYAETGEVRYKSIALTLEKEAVREMETAAAAERARSNAANR